MTPAPKSLVRWVALIAAVGVYLALLPSQRPAPATILDPPWIGLPQTGMDASQPPLRELLAQSSGARHRLSATCGKGNDVERERYRLWVSRNTWEDFREIEFLPRGEWLEVSVRDGLPPPPPEPTRDGATTPDDIEVHPIVHARIRRRDAEPIRRAWNTQGLWHAEQKPLGCHDGRPIVLEACIDGRYAIRLRHCDADAHLPTQAMWEAVERLLPVPEPAYWRAQ
jgi:hypothetical protein